MKQCSYGGMSNIIGNTNEYFTIVKLQLLKYFFQFALSSIPKGSFLLVIYFQKYILSFISYCWNQGISGNPV